MWLCELAEVVQKVREVKGNDVVLKKVTPAYDGIVFETTYFTYIKWYRIDGRIEEHEKDEWRKK